ncbi:MAG: S8 family serine peptidase, partial [Gammaproteobacteria bacterium]|nr:S8 family serine peptidase [Gammaproteobacteria bacterium]
MSATGVSLRGFVPGCLLMLLLAGCGGSGGGSGQSTGPGGFTASGTLMAAAGSAADSDVNDPAAAYVDNDTVINAQDIPNPVTLGGYANQVGYGAVGRSYVVGDTSDVYRVSLAANQTITLSIADSTAGDLDLFLGDVNGFLLDSSEGTGVTETLTIANAGTYLVEVFAFSGASNYTLVIGQQITAAGKPALSSMDNFVTDEVVTKFRATPSTRQLNSASQLASRHGMTARAGAPGRAMLLGMNPGAARLATPVEKRPVMLGTDKALVAKWKTLQAVKQLRQQADVEYAEPNYIRQTTLVPGDQFYPLQWHYPLINLPQAWDITTGDNNVTVAVIDTGVLTAHPDLQGQLVAGYDFVSNPANANDGNGIDADPDDPGDSSAGGSSFHGTHVAGTVAAATNNASGA